MDRELKRNWSSDSNQLQYGAYPYKGTPGYYESWLDVLADTWPEGYSESETLVGGIPTYDAKENFIQSMGDEGFDVDGVGLVYGNRYKRKFFLSWTPLPEAYSVTYARYRMRTSTNNATSYWSMPQKFYTPVRYAIYKRKVTHYAAPNEWTLHEVTTKTSVNYVEDFYGRVQYAVCIYHKDAKPSKWEGTQLHMLTFGIPYATIPVVENPYCLIMTNPYSVRMNTARFIKLPPEISPHYAPVTILPIEGGSGPMVL